MKTEELISYAMGEKKADLVLKGGKVANVITRELLDADVVIAGDTIVHVGKDTSIFCDAKTTIIDVSNKIVCPGLIESHIHVESSMLSLTEFTKAIIKHGTTTCVIDPHEIANVCGEKGIELFINESKDLPVRFLIEASSCVPSLAGFETPGAVIDSTKIKELMKKHEIFGLAEMMNYPGVYLKNDEVIKKIDAAKEEEKIVEGHAPLLTGKELQAYIAAGISSDHEATNAKEALEKLRLGMKLQVREGSFAKDLEPIFHELKNKINKIDSRNILIASDDRNPVDLVEKGHLDYSFKKLVKLGIEPLLALQFMTINTASHLKMNDKIGSIAPGKIADIIVIDNFTNFEVKYTLISGKIVYEKDKLRFTENYYYYPEEVINTTKYLSVPSENELKVSISTEKNTLTVKVIGIKEHSLITESLVKELKVKDNYLVPNVKEDIIPVVVVNRHTAEKRISKGFINGLGIRNCAIASTVAHDCHQLICAGTDYSLMTKAISEIKRIGGGQVIAFKDRVISLPLKIAGLMSLDRLDEVYSKAKILHNAAKETGSSLSDPFMALAFIALPVIPHLKITDLGLVDVDNFQFTDLIVK